MKFSLTVVSVVAAIASASASIILPRQSLPNCAGPCIANAKTGDCDPTDDTCLCRNNDFITSTSDCIMSSCTGSDLQNALAAAQELCLAVGVTLTSSTSATAASSTATAPSSASTSASSASDSTSAAASSSTSTTTSNGARANAVNAMAGLAAIGLVAVAL